MRTMAVVALAGIGASVACLALANAIDPSVYTMDRHGFVFAGCTVPAENSPNSTQDLAWDGDSTVTINVPATVHYQPGGGDTVHVTGPSELMSHLRVRDGRIELDCNLSGSDRQLDLVLPGRAFRTFTLNGTGHLVLENLNQQALNVNLHGEGDVRATGMAEDLSLTLAGAGKADLGHLSVQRSKVRIAGAGEAELAPKDSADITIAGAGEIRFLEQPLHLQTHIVGAGRIINAPTQGL
jgi:hypothetical protein